MILSTTPQIEGHTIREYKGIVTGETIIGANMFKDLFAGIRDIVGGRAGAYEKVLSEAITKFFGASDESTIAEGSRALRIFALSFIPFCYIYVLMIVYKLYGHHRMALFISFALSLTVIPVMWAVSRWAPELLWYSYLIAYLVEALMIFAFHHFSRLRFTLKMAVAATIALSGGMSLSACSDGKSIPAAPDYQDSTQWYVTNRQAAADVFYIISTETGDYRLPNGEMCHWADTYSDSLRAPLYAEMLGVDTLISGRLNFFSPYYRQCSLQSFQSDSLTAERMPLATDDVRRAFKHYLKHQNGGRPFILAGFSQGAHIMLELLKEMDDHTYQKHKLHHARLGTEYHGHQSRQLEDRQHSRHTHH